MRSFSPPIEGGLLLKSKLNVEKNDSNLIEEMCALIGV